MKFVNDTTALRDCLSETTDEIALKLLEVLGNTQPEEYTLANGLERVKLVEAYEDRLNNAEDEHQIEGLRGLLEALQSTASETLDVHKVEFEETMFVVITEESEGAFLGAMMSVSQ